MTINDSRSTKKMLYLLIDTSLVEIRNRRRSRARRKSVSVFWKKIRSPKKSSASSAFRIRQSAWLIAEADIHPGGIEGRWAVVAGPGLVYRTEGRNGGGEGILLRPKNPTYYTQYVGDNGRIHANIGRRKKSFDLPDDRCAEGRSFYGYIRNA